jgi:hypothetical protein
VDIGNGGNARAVQGDVTITNQGSFTQVNVNDGADVLGRDVTLGVDANGFGFISGLAQGTVRFKAADTLGVIAVGSSLNASHFTVLDTVNHGGAAPPVTQLVGGIADDTFTVRKTTGKLDIQGLAGSDTVNVGSVANKIDGIQGAISFNGGIDNVNDFLFVNDQGSTTSHVYNQTLNSISRDGAALISFANVNKVTLKKGALAGSVPAAKDLKLAAGPKGSRLATLSGQLTDEDAHAKLQLSIDWGDGSKPQVLEPGQSPFRLKHRYHHKGSYAVRVVWTDVGNGQSNSQDFNLKIA